MADLKKVTLNVLFWCALTGQAAYADVLSEKNEYCAHKTYENLSSGMSSGNYQSLIDFIRCHDHFDGGNAEDLHRQAGEFLDSISGE